MLKRKLDDIDDNIDEDESSSCSTNTNSSADVPDQDISGKRVRKKKSVQFDGVTVYYFSRIQGFTCVPSEGGSTLGMSSKHVHKQEFSLQDHAKEQRRLHQLFIEEQREQGKTILEFIDTKSDEEDLDADDSDLDSEIDEYYFLQPLSIKQRRMTLRQSGVKKIDSKEKEHCKDIRESREHCGCDCKVFCDPESCACCLADIKCQVDRVSFPCGCSKDGCGNTYGRIEFNPIRVRAHYVHTVMRLKLEKQDDDVSPISNRCRYVPHGDMSNGEILSSSSCSKAVNTVGVSPIKQQDIDLCQFNSNELGSCRDCQNPDVCNIMMQEVQYAAMEAEQQRVALNNLYNSSQQYKSMVSNTNNSANSGASMPQVLLFNDNEEDMYNAENTTTFFNFKQEENSYSESSECSSEGTPGLDGNEYPKTYQTLTSFEVNGENPNQGYNNMESQHGVYPQNDQKYMSVNTAHQIYKMNSFSGIVPPVQSENAYNADGYNNDSWHPKEVPATATSTCSYTTMTNTTCDKIAESCPSISSHISNNSQDSCDNLKINGYTDMNGFGCGTSIVEEKTYLNLSENTVSVDQVSQVICETRDRQMNNMEQNHINNFLSKNASAVSHVADNSAFVTSSVPKVTKPVSMHDHMEVEMPCPKDVSCPQGGQNFGEIIKESIFETVSA